MRAEVGQASVYMFSNWVYRRWADQRDYSIKGFFEVDEDEVDEDVYEYTWSPCVQYGWQQHFMTAVQANECNFTLLQGEVKDEPHFLKSCDFNRNYLDQIHHDQFDEVTAFVEFVRVGDLIESKTLVLYEIDYEVFEDWCIDDEYIYRRELIDDEEGHTCDELFWLIGSMSNLDVLIPKDQQFMDRLNIFQELPKLRGIDNYITYAGISL